MFGEYYGTIKVTHTKILEINFLNVRPSISETYHRFIVRIKINNR